MRAAIITIALLMFGSVGNADSDRDTSTTGGENTTVSTKTVEKPNKRSCRKVKVTGSHLKQRVCMTNASWRELEEQQELERAKARALSADPTNAIN